MANLQRPSPEIERRLSLLEKEIKRLSSPVVNDGESWTPSSEVLYIAYASALSNLTSEGTIPNQSDATDFGFSPFTDVGALLAYRGRFTSTATYPSGDPTDYIWEATSDTVTASSYVRYYSTDSELLVDLGNPDDPGAGITWTSIAPATAIPDSAYWLADQYTIDGAVSEWQIYPVKVLDATSRNLGVISYTKSGSNKPVLNDATWQADVILAANAFTGLTYSTHTELGYGATVVITYDDGKLYGTLQVVATVDTWVAAPNFLDGNLVVDGTITTDHIAANTIAASDIASNTITASEIATGTITATEIDVSTLNVDEMTLNGQLDVSANSGSIAWGKTSFTDQANTGAFLGNDASGEPGFQLGDANSYIQYIDGYLYVVNAINTGPPTLGSNQSFTDPSASTAARTYNIPPGTRELTLDLTGAGGGGGGPNGNNSLNSATYNSATLAIDAQYGYSGNTNHDNAGTAGGNTVATLYDGPDGTGSVIGTYTANGGAGGAKQTNSAFAKQTSLSGVTTNPAAPPGSVAGEDEDSSQFTGTGGAAWDATSDLFADCGGSQDNYLTCGTYVASTNATGVGSGGGAGGVHIVFRKFGENALGWSAPGSNGDNLNQVLDVIALGVTGGSIVFAPGNGGAGAGSETNGSGATPNVNSGSRAGSAGSDGGARVEITDV